jgi:hypothetical protein
LAIAAVIALSCALGVASPARGVSPIRTTALPSDPAERHAEPDELPGPFVAVSIPPGSRPYSLLPPLTLVAGNGGATCTVKLYRDDGTLDDEALATIERTLADVRDPAHPAVASLDPRLLRVLARAAYHWESPTIRVVSAYRAPRRRSEGLHAKGRAIDFALDGVPPRELAAWLRAHPRLGVGVYVHRLTQYVHLDVRETSFHWIDGSPPHRSGWPASLGSFGLEALDATWEAAIDLPEGTKSPSSAPGFE